MDFKADTAHGQHFLMDNEFIERTVGMIPPGAPVVEIGAGTGILTRGLLENGNPVIAYEVDERCRPQLEDLQRGSNVELEVRWQNFLQVQPHELRDIEELHIVGNVPFHISEPLIHQLTEVDFEQSVLLVGDRMAATLTTDKPDTPGWGRMSMVSQAYFETDIVAAVPREAFDPQPRVDAALVRQIRKGEDGEANLGPVAASYKAIVEADRDHSTIASALKGVMVDGKGEVQLPGTIDRVSANRHQRRLGTTSLKHLARRYNLTGTIDTNSMHRGPAPPETMFTIVSRSVPETTLSRPLSNSSNLELRSVCSAIQAAVNRRTRR